MLRFVRLTPSASKNADPAGWLGNTSKRVAPYPCTRELPLGHQLWQNTDAEEAAPLVVLSEFPYPNGGISFTGVPVVIGRNDTAPQFSRGWRTASHTGSSRAGQEDNRDPRHERRPR